MNTVIIKYNAGNTQSVLYALERIGVSAVVTDEPEQIRGADKVIFPGVGEASTAMQYLRERGLDRLIPSLRQPVLGVCLGMQLLCRHSEENDTHCLGIFDLGVRRFPASSGKVPQIGWNMIYDLSSPLFEGIAERSYVYGVHSYYVEKSPFSIATTDYGLSYSAAISRDNFYAVQFHPEKSADVGQRILENFILKIN
ncbi:imidazole glycerol phosphate synthase subunit HisH [Compostibacter hankyongensis]|uniref:Imidazole glycerol phosphate synthase subunit HisH n=1 Tax=Compostibacter hankyongensis TaxID=1007089 RepID=A0ABP8FX50_9BACT